jgi:sacsin
LRLALLAEASEDIDVQLHGSAEAFGQHEALTTRLKHILDAYADGPGVISELVQNADDAGATEVRLLLDQTGGGDKSLLGPKMARWQGPALVAWNDAVFSPNDFHNIARIGQDSKIDAPAAAGRFGLVQRCFFYFRTGNLTDVMFCLQRCTTSRTFRRSCPGITSSCSTRTRRTCPARLPRGPD